MNILTSMSTIPGTVILPDKSHIATVIVRYSNKIFCENNLLSTHHTTEWRHIPTVYGRYSEQTTPAKRDND